MYQTVRFRKCLGFFFCQHYSWEWVYKMVQACILVLVCKDGIDLYLVAGLLEGAVLYIEGRFLRRFFQVIRFGGLIWVRNISIITRITVNCISHSLNSAITKENIVFSSGRASISGLGIAKTLKKIFSNGSSQKGRDYNEYLKIEIGSNNFYANFEMF